jgi:hypothetical protein
VKAIPVILLAALVLYVMALLHIPTLVAAVIPDTLTVWHLVAVLVALGTLTTLSEIDTRPRP